ncbi:MAG: spermidine synthase [Gammaproteobacteria bacterium]|nr:spermidine synthase [Gammaproteobacteria bacterium]
MKTATSCKSTRKYHGVLLYSTSDEWGPIEVVESATERSLHFGTAAKQSAYFFNNPQALALNYTQSMLATLLFLPEPQRVLHIGLGGGSLLRFLHHHYPQLQQEVVELRPAVYRVAKRFFACPEAAEITLHLDPVERFCFLHGRHLQHRFDLILVDAFDADGLSSELNDPHLMRQFHSFLSPSGVLGINLWSNRSSAVNDLIAVIKQQFAGDLLRLDVPDKGNQVVIAGQRLSFNGCEERAEYLQRRIALPFPDMVERLLRLNFQANLERAVAGNATPF